MIKPGVFSATGCLTVAITGVALAASLSFSSVANAAVVISQVYGGGGNSGATIKNDFIELFNNGTTAQTIGGWTVQYASAAGTGWATTAIPAGTSLPPGRYFLIKQAPGAGGTVDIAFDLSGTIALSGSSGKVALVDSAIALAGAAPTGVNILDIVSYGSGTPTEGTATAVLSNTTAAIRNAAGCTDTGNNSADFTVATPAPRSLATAALDCGTGGPGGGYLQHSRQWIGQPLDRPAGRYQRRRDQNFEQRLLHTRPDGGRQPSHVRWHFGLHRGHGLPGGPSR